MCSLVFARALTQLNSLQIKLFCVCARAARGERAKEKSTNKLKSVMIQTKRPRKEEEENTE